MRPFRLSHVASLAAFGGLTVLAALAGLTVTASGQSPGSPPPSAVATPRLPNGKPDLTGMWNGPGSSTGRRIAYKQEFSQFENRQDDGDIERYVPSRRCAPNQEGCRDNTNQSNDREFTYRNDPNVPLYKPEHWDRVQFLDYDTNFSDPMMRCVPLGIPRVGPPTRIIQMPTDMVFLYDGRDHDYRIISTDGRPHDKDAFPSYWGDAIGRWDGDTFVIETTNFNDQTWIASGIVGGGGGYFHSFEMKVTERLRREGNVLYYDVTVEDPVVLEEPWKMNPYQLRLNTNPNTRIREGLPCREYDSEMAVSRIRH